MLDKFITLSEVVPSLNSATRKLLQDYTEYLRNHPTTQTVAVNPEFAWPEIHNFYAYCKLAAIEDNQIYPMMLLNGITNPLEFTPDIYPTLITPSSNTVAQIIATLP